MSRPAAGPGRALPDDSHGAWTLVRALSPHPRVRVADVDELGAVTNLYRSTAPANGPAPAAGLPYAVHLADERGRYRLLGFDLDAHKGPVAADLARLRELLTHARLPHVVCASGPGGGRHVWVALSQPVTAVVVAGIARGLARLLPSLDISPLTNPRTGALRPPLAPHRLGGRSEIVDGRLTDLRRPTSSAAQVLALAGLVQAAQTLRAVSDRPVSLQTTTRDTDGHRCLPGPRRALSARTRAALHDVLPAGADASAVLATALCGAVRARWHLADLIALLSTAPGLLHARTERTAAGRRTRPAAEQTAVLARQWNRAVDTVAAGPRLEQLTADSDPTYETRCAAVVAAVAAVQRRADASPGRWAQGGGPADRRVLDVACHLMLTAVTTDIELDTRRLALLTGIGRGTAHLALRRLTADRWLTPSTPAAGIHGAHWALPDTVTAVDTAPITTAVGRERTPVDPSTHQPNQGRTQGTPSPLQSPSSVASSARTAWLSHLTHRTTTVLHDAFTAAGLGHHTARTYQALTRTPADVVELSHVTGYCPHRLHRHLDRLADHQLARTDRTGRWIHPGHQHQLGDRLDRAARVLGVAGILADRDRRYRLERDAWAWWTDELAWRRLPTSQKRRTPGAGQTVLPLAGHDTLTRHHRGPHPRHRNGRADFAAARHHLNQLPHAS